MSNDTKRLGILLGFGVATCVAVACSSSNNNPLASQATAEQDGGCVGPTGTTASDGQGYVASRGCPTCHGADMSGSTTPLSSSQISGTIPSGVYLYPPNLTPDTTTGIGDWTSDQIRYAIIYGIDDLGMDLCPEMKHYATMCEDEALGIIAYLRSLPAVTKSIPGSICPPLKNGTTPPPAADGG
jgi:hypothetical protein